MANHPATEMSKRRGNGGKAVFRPRLWPALLVLAVPFIMVCADCLEALERSGRWGAYLAGMLLPASITGYLALVVVLKQRRI
jgi:hypothetical protein